MTSRYRILAYWGPRPETPAACAPKALQMFEALSKLDPVFANWSINSLNEKPVPISSLGVEQILQIIASGQHYTDVGHQPMRDLGYSIYAHNNLLKPRTLSMSTKLGGYTTSNQFANKISIHTRWPCEEPFIDIRILKPVLLALVQIWNANWGDVSPMEFYEQLPRDKNRHSPRFRGGWMTYLSAPFAAKIEPPHSAICERTPGGGLLMTATKERFDVANPAHVAVARDINAALAPLNALPWPPNDTADGPAKFQSSQP